MAERAIAFIPKTYAELLRRVKATLFAGQRFDGFDGFDPFDRLGSTSLTAGGFGRLTASRLTARVR